MSNRLRLGIFITLGDNIEEKMKEIRELGLGTCQINCWNPDQHTEEWSDRLVKASKEYEVEVTSFWAGYSGTCAWNFTEGPTTIGLVPPETRQMRLEQLKSGARFAAKCGISSITTHVGFIPETPCDPLYTDTIDALRELAQLCKELGINFLFETGQETPTTLLRAILDIGTDNLGINLDPANLLMYGKANPVDALDLIGPYVRGVHAKDGEYPTNPRELGTEKKLGEGRVNFPLLVPKLKTFGFNGPLTIEREISGDEQIADIRHAIELLSPLC